MKPMTRLLKIFQIFMLRMILRIIVMGSLLAAAVSIRADDEHLATLRVGTEVYSNVTVTSVSVTDIFFTHSCGVGNAKLKNLDPAVQKMFHFDPAKSDAQQADQAKANALYNQAVRNSPPPKRSPAPEPEPEPQQPGTANGIRDHAIKAKSFLNQAAPSLQIEKWLTDQPDTSTTDVLAQSNALKSLPWRQPITWARRSLSPTK